MNELRVVFMGTPDFAVPILEALIENTNVVGVVSQPDRRVGRKQELVHTPLYEVALKISIQVFQPSKIRVEYEDILKLNPDLIITCAYGQIIPKEILDYPRLGCINVHASLLPKLRGGAPIHKAIIEGYSKTGITIMYMDEKMDSGDIISQEETTILDSDNLDSLYDRLSLMGQSLLIKTLPSIIEGTNCRIKQDDNEVTYAYNVSREEERIDFNRESRCVFNQIRGLSPIPGAYAVLDGKSFKIYSAYIDDVFSNGNPGQIFKVDKKGIYVYTKDSAVVITELKPFGKKKMDAVSYLNGINKVSLIGKVFE